MLEQFHLHQERFLTEFSSDEGEETCHVDASVHKPYMSYSRKDEVPSQVLGQSAAGDGRATSESDFSLPALPGKGAASERANGESITAQMEPALLVKFKKACKRRQKHSKGRTTVASSSTNATSGNGNSIGKKYLKKSLRKQVHPKASLVNLREISSAGPVSKRPARRASFTSYRAKTSGRTNGRFALTNPHTRNCKKQKQTSSVLRRLCKLRRNSRSLELAGLQKSV